MNGKKIFCQSFRIDLNGFLGKFYSLLVLVLITPGMLEGRRQGGGGVHPLRFWPALTARSPDSFTEVTLLYVRFVVASYFSFWGKTSLKFSDSFLWRLMMSGAISLTSSDTKTLKYITPLYIRLLTIV